MVKKQRLEATATKDHNLCACPTICRLVTAGWQLTPRRDVSGGEAASWTECGTEWKIEYDGVSLLTVAMTYDEETAP
jgi:hypothetical protein